ncbi:MAG: isochorismatase family protein [Spirochaetales bacterium]|nr:isochorismatase family protein [Spirochaetales bacterium]
MKALLVIDIQENLMARALLNREVFIAAVNSAIRQCRGKRIPVIFVQHNNNFLVKGESGWQLFSGLERQDDDRVFQKSHSNAFDEKDLEEFCIATGIAEVIVCGLVTHGCVRSTCLGGLDKGYTMKLLANGHTSWGKDATARIEKVEAELRNVNIEVINSIE